MLQAGNFTELPTIKMKTTTGINASFTPVFNVIRDPQPVEPIAKDIVQVFDLVGLNINGYVDGKEYYGNVYFKDGVKFAGSSTKSGTNIRVFETREASISGVNVPVARTVRQDQTIRTSPSTPETQTVAPEPQITQPSLKSLNHQPIFLLHHLRHQHQHHLLVQHQALLRHRHQLLAQLHHHHHHQVVEVDMGVTKY